MNRYTTPLKNASVAFSATGVWNAVVTGVPDHRLMVRVPRLSGDMEYGPLYVIGESTDTYSIGDPVIVSFLEGKQDELIVVGRAKQTNETPAVIEGPQGPQGATGAQGEIGPQGYTGTPGTNGVNGAQGPQGPAGAVGGEGLEGPQGDTGPQGAQGAQGPQGASAPTFTYKVGDTGPGGGIIFFVDRYDEYAGFTYLEVAPVSTQVQRFWAPSSPVNYQSTAVTGADSKALGAGYQNTIDMVNQGHTSEASSAAKYCADLVSGGQSDWYLGSIAEMKTIYGVLHLQLGVGGFVADYYWSSSEFSATSAWNQNFFYGNEGLYAKNSAIYVRPVRRFS